jgi:hypothetical protein
VPHDNVERLDGVERDLADAAFQSLLQRVQRNLKNKNIFVALNIFILISIC